MNTDFLGNGWQFDLTDTGDPSLGMVGVGLGPNGGIAEASDEDDILQSIWLILSTAPGERVGRPQFGCGIHNLIFATQSPGTFGDIINAVEQALAAWEPRIDVLDVDASPASSTSDPSAVIIQIDYRVKSTNSRSNLVYPFYLSS